jgi:hypothetical protein
MTTTMWEVQAADGQLEPLLAWVRSRVDPAAQVYRSTAGEARVVVIDPTGGAASTLAATPTQLVTRPPHAWDFDLVAD